MGSQEKIIIMGIAIISGFCYIINARNTNDSKRFMRLGNKKLCRIEAIQLDSEKNNNITINTNDKIKIDT